MCGARAVFSKVLKEIVRIERPQATCQALGLCGDLGWPSTHSQISAFALITMLLRRKGAAPLSPGRTAAETAEIWVLTLLTASVAWSRVYLGYHDLQVTHCYVPNTSLLTWSVHVHSLLCSGKHIGSVANERCSFCEHSVANNAPYHCVGPGYLGARHNVY